MINKGTLIQICVFFITLAIILYVLMEVKHEVNVLEKELIAYEAEIISEKKQLHILQAEWHYLSSPKRIQKLAHKHLTLSPAKNNNYLYLEGDK